MMAALLHCYSVCLWSVSIMCVLEEVPHTYPPSTNDVMVKAEKHKSLQEDYTESTYSFCKYHMTSVDTASPVLYFKHTQIQAAFRMH